jgi:hypothetical protein
MTILQHLYVTVFVWGPSILLGFVKAWWVGVLAFVLSFIISWILMFAVTSNMPPRVMTAWAWVNPPFIAAIVLSAGWWAF